MQKVASVVNTGIIVNCNVDFYNYDHFMQISNALDLDLIIIFVLMKQGRLTVSL